MKHIHLAAILALSLVALIGLFVDDSIMIAEVYAQDANLESGPQQYLNEYEKAFNTGDYAGAAKVAKEALKVMELNPALRGETSLVSMFLTYEGKAYVEIGQHKKADAAFQDALRRLESQPANFIAEKQIVKNNIAMNAHLLGNLDQAEQMYLTIIETAEAQNALPNMIMLRNNLAGVYSDQARFGEAEAQLKQAIAAIETQTPVPQQELAYLLNNLAETVRTAGRPQEAEALHRRALSIRQNNAESDRRMVAASMINIGMSLFDQGRMNSAEEQLTLAIELLDSLFPNGHPTTAAALGNKAEIARSEERFEDAQQLEAKSLTMNQLFLPPGHHTLAIQHHNLGISLIALQQYGQAEDHIEKAIEIRESAYSSTHPYTLSSYTLLGWLALKTGNPTEAARLADLASDEITSSALLPAQGGVRNEERDNRYDTYLLQIEAAWALSNE